MAYLSFMSYFPPKNVFLVLEVVTNDKDVVEHGKIM
jgi:hypothetical protein